jgi:adenylyltransferase/sulfurtransferase
MDVVDLSNLNRQILHWNENLGQYKVKSAASKLLGMNPSVKITPVQTKIDAGNVSTLIKGADLIIDAMDNFRARHILNRAAIADNIPLVHGSVRGLEGRITTIIPGKTPCLECLVPQEPPEETLPVLGATAGVIGSLQVTEAIKYLTGVGSLLTNRFLIYDGEFLEFHEVRVRCDPACKACSHLQKGENRER